MSMMLQLLSTLLFLLLTDDVGAIGTIVVTAVDGVRCCLMLYVYTSIISTLSIYSPRPRDRLKQLHTRVARTYTCIHV